MGAVQRGDGLVRTDGDNGISAQRDRLRDAAMCILGVNSTVQQDEVRGRLR
jgi:hypothetical protein